MLKMNEMMETKMTRLPGILVWTALLILLQGCGINSNWMLKTHREFEFAPIDSLNETKEGYVIDVNDIVQFRFFTNDGIKILDITSASEGGNQMQLFNPNNALSYVIQSDSMVRLPLLDTVNLVGMTIRQAELYLQDRYGYYYQDPFVQLTITNRRVVIFPGSGGEAQVIYLSNNNTTLMEVIGLAGGITERGRASRILLVRKNENGKRLVYKIDLSTIEGLQYTDLIVQANDYIYIEPVPELGREILKDVSPVVSLITSGAVLIAVFTQ
jgi:polysaccharide biosynthesis/export protein